VDFDIKELKSKRGCGVGDFREVNSVELFLPVIE